MAESIIQVAPDSTGKKLHTNSRTIGANTVEDEFTLSGEFPYATYTVVAASVATTTAASHLMQIMAGASLNVRIRRIRVTQNVAPAGVTVWPLQVLRLTTAGTGGTSVTARPYDSADAAAGGGGMTLPSAKGTEGVILWDQALWLGTGAIPVNNNSMEWIQLPNSKPILIPAGTSNGIAIKNTIGVATSTVDISIEFVETAFV